MLTLKRDKESLEEEITKLKDRIVFSENEVRMLQTTLKETNDVLMQRRIALAQLEPLLDVKRSKYERLQQEYEEINPNDEFMTEDVVDEVIGKLNRAYMERDELSSNLALIRERRLALGNEVQRKEVLIRQYHDDTNKLTQEKHRS